MNHTSFIPSLKDLQVGQHQHDVLAHQDILQQLIPKKLTHFTLHFAKYQGAISRALRNKDADGLKRALTDTLIIALAAANAMNMNLQDRLKLAKASAGLSVESFNAASSQELLGSYVETVGNMAKACEVLDHLEDFPSRTVLERSTLELLLVVDCLARLEDLDLKRAVAERWKSVEGKVFLSPESKASLPMLSAA